MGIFSMSTFRALALCFLASVLMSACGGDPFWLPRAHKITIQQGNLISQTQLERVTVGMNRDEVRSLIGTPVANLPFQTDRWDYIYTQGPAGSEIRAKRVSILFQGDQVSGIDNNQDLESGEKPTRRYWWERFSSSSQSN